MIRTVFLLLALPLLVQPFRSVLAEESVVYPEFSLTEKDVPNNDATLFSRALGPGWNLGNAFDAVDVGWLSDELDYEKAWCGVRTTPELIRALADAGFRTIRIPVSWHNHLNADGIISTRWLTRVRQVADLCLAHGMKVILNIHHDISEACIYPDSAHLESSRAYLTGVWKQVADAFRDYDENLILESMNEPRLTGTEWEWNWREDISACQDAMDCINQLNQAFVDTVRATGSRNADRFLMIPGYAAKPESTLSDLFQLPLDTVPNRLMISVHAYTPYDFALNTAGTPSFSVDRSADKSSVALFMEDLYQKWITAGIPVVIGECGALNKNNLQSRVDWTAWYYTCAAIRGIPCLWWDNNAVHGSGENFGLINRGNAAWVFPEIPKAMGLNID